MNSKLKQDQKKVLQNVPVETPSEKLHKEYKNTALE